MTYEVARIFEGIKLILFRVRASGMGMLLTNRMERSGVGSTSRVSPNPEITVLNESKLS